MATPLIAKLMEIAYSQVQSDLAEHEIEDRLIDNLVGKSLNFTTNSGDEGVISFQSIGRGTYNPSTVVNLQIEGIEFTQDAQRLTLDLRYIFYQEYGYGFLFNGTTTKFLITSPVVQKLGPTNILLEYVMFGDTIYHIDRSLRIFAQIIQRHESELHQTAMKKYQDIDVDWSDELELSLEEPISVSRLTNNPIEYIRATGNDEAYIKDYIRYIENPEGEFREMIDSRNTYAKSDFE